MNDDTPQTRQHGETARPTTDFLALQSSLVLGNLEQSVKVSRRFAEITFRMADVATKTITVQAEKTAIQAEK